MPRGSGLGGRRNGLHWRTSFCWQRVVAWFGGTRNHPRQENAHAPVSATPFFGAGGALARCPRPRPVSELFFLKPSSWRVCVFWLGIGASHLGGLVLTFLFACGPNANVVRAFARALSTSPADGVFPSEFGRTPLASGPTLLAPQGKTRVLLVCLDKSCVLPFGIIGVGLELIGMH